MDFKIVYSVLKKISLSRDIFLNLNFLSSQVFKINTKFLPPSIRKTFSDCYSTENYTKFTVAFIFG